MSSSYFKDLDEVAGKRYLEKLSYKEDTLPDPMDDDLRKRLFSSNLKHLPNLSFGDLFIYLVVSNDAFTAAQLKNYKSLESYNFLLSGKVFDLKLYRNVKLQVCIITCHVQASQTLSKVHKPWAVVECAGKILSAHCSCMAGLGEACSHVAALFFAVEAAAREGASNPSCTSMRCAWKKTSKKVVVIPAANISFSHKSRKEIERQHNAMQLPTDEAYNKFFNFIKNVKQ